MFNQPFTPSQVRPIRPAMTVSRPAQLGHDVLDGAVAMVGNGVQNDTISHW